MERRRQTGFNQLFRTLQTDGTVAGWKPSRFKPPKSLKLAEFTYIGVEQSPAKAEVLDVDPSGIRLMLSPKANVWKGLRCMVAIHLDGHPPFECYGVVRWIHVTPMMQLVGVIPELD